MSQTSPTYSLYVLSLLAVCTLPAMGDDAVIDTPSILSSIEGVWQLEIANMETYRQRLHLGNDSGGQWLRDRESVLTPITYYIEGNELLVHYYVAPNEPTNFRMKQERFRYRLIPSGLILTDEECRTTRWTRIQATGIRVDREYYTIREFRVNDNQSVFTVDVRKGDAQMGITIAMELAGIADSRGFRFALSHRGPETSRAGWVDFYKEQPTKEQLDDAVHVLPVEMWVPIYKDTMKRLKAANTKQIAPESN